MWQVDYTWGCGMGVRSQNDAVHSAYGAVCGIEGCSMLILLQYNFFFLFTSFCAIYQTVMLPTLILKLCSTFHNDWLIHFAVYPMYDNKGLSPN